VPASNAVFAYTPRRSKYDAVSCRLGPQPNLARDVMLYATASRGYNLTQTQAAGTVVNDTRIDAEIAECYETAIKSQVVNRCLTVNVTAFHSIFSNVQTTVGAGPLDDRWTVSLYARNLLKENLVSRMRHNFSSTFQLPAHEAQRRFGVQLSGRF
jgi:outer membrane receptor protein involved in Fe transport